VDELILLASVSKDPITSTSTVKSGDKEFHASFNSPKIVKDERAAGSLQEKEQEPRKTIDDNQEAKA
jgi:hypothetical protein